MDQIYVPSKIKGLIIGKSFTIDEIGLSGNQVLIFEDMVLKIEDSSEDVVRQAQIMQWLEGKIPVPQVLAYEEENGKSYLLMSRISGEMSCDTYYLENPDILLEGLVSGLKMLWEVDIKDCPCKCDPEVMLEGVEPVLSHGDYCLPNIFLENGRVSGFIDLGRAGIGDKWNDIALCYRSLKHNFDGTYGGKVYEDFDPNRLFEKLGIEPDWDKINYYLLLDELF